MVAFVNVVREEVVVVVEKVSLSTYLNCYF